MAIEQRDFSPQGEPEIKQGEVIVFPITKFEIDQRPRLERIERRRRRLSTYLKTEDQVNSFLDSEIEDTTTIKDIIYLKSQEEGYRVDTVTDKINGKSTVLTTPSGRTHSFTHTFLSEPQIQE
jgi:hypothetical protein